ncbi:MAG: glycine/betaine ABC transporter, partial [Ruminiclostridium sp.]|nr:glycine/betaine ABC transporter [Ruminiclostridium sp.]
MIDFVIPLADWVNAVFDVVSYYISPVLRSFSSFLEVIIKQFEAVLLWPPEAVFMIAIGLIVWRLAGIRLAVFAVVGLLVTFGLQVWEEAIATIVLALSGTAVSLLLGVPLGIIASQSDTVERILRPILDFMQTLPSFVYLIPAVMFFG